MTLTVGSLFSGIGGIDLGLERAGMRVVWQSEIDPYACRVLAKHWPHVPNLGDVRAVDWSIVERPDLICGGYPCQPFSLAGARGGHADHRHLWPAFADALRHLRPRLALLENVPGHLSLGFGSVLGDLAELGYDTEWQCIPAAAVGAPHLRWRVFVVAYADSESEPARTVDAPLARFLVPDGDREGLRHQSVGVGRGEGPSIARNDGTTRDVAYTDGAGLAFGESERRDDGSQQTAAQRGGDDVAHPESDLRRAGLCESRSGGIGLTEPGDGGWWSVEPDVGRVAHGVPNRMDRLRVLGNAVVPQVAEWIGRRILDGVSPNDGSRS